MTTAPAPLTRWTRTGTKHGAVSVSHCGRYTIEPSVRFGKRVGWKVTGSTEPGPWPTVEEAKRSVERDRTSRPFVHEGDVVTTLACLPEDLPVRGNAMASGDPAVDLAAENAILKDLDWNQWAWCHVVVRVAWVGPSGRQYHAEASLGACSYPDEASFRGDGSYLDLVAEALACLNEDLRTTCDDVARTLAKVGR